MGLYIEKMELPKGGNETIIRILPNGKILDQYGHHLGVSALSVPPHGRLIDADEMRDEWLINGENEYVYDTNAFLESIDNQPTVISAEFGGAESK